MPEGIEYKTNEHGGQDATVSVPPAVAEAAGIAPGSLEQPVGMELPPGYDWDELDEEQKGNLIEFHNQVIAGLQAASIWVVPIGGDEHPDGHEWAVVQRGTNVMFGTYVDPQHAEIVGIAFARYLRVNLNVQSEDGRITSTSTYPVVE